MQAQLFSHAYDARKTNTHTLTNKEDFYQFLKDDGGFALAHFNRDPDIEAKLKQELSVTIRCIPFEKASGTGKCIFTGEKNEQQVIFAKAY